MLEERGSPSSDTTADTERWGELSAGFMAVDAAVEALQCMDLAAGGRTDQPEALLLALMQGDLPRARELLDSPALGLPLRAVLGAVLATLDDPTDPDAHRLAVLAVWTMPAGFTRSLLVLLVHASRAATSGPDADVQWRHAAAAALECRRLGPTVLPAIRGLAAVAEIIEALESTDGRPRRHQWQTAAPWVVLGPAIATLDRVMTLGPIPSRYAPSGLGAEPTWTVAVLEQVLGTEAADVIVAIGAGRRSSPFPTAPVWRGLAAARGLDLKLPTNFTWRFTTWVTGAAVTACWLVLLVGSVGLSLMQGPFTSMQNQAWALLAGLTLVASGVHAAVVARSRPHLRHVAPDWRPFTRRVISAQWWTAPHRTHLRWFTAGGLGLAVGFLLAGALNLLGQILEAPTLGEIGQGSTGICLLGSIGVAGACNSRILPVSNSGHAGLRATLSGIPEGAAFGGPPCACPDILLLDLHQSTEAISHLAEPRSVPHLSGQVIALTCPTTGLPWVVMFDRLAGVRIPAHQPISSQSPPDAYPGQYL